MPRNTSALPPGDPGAQMPAGGNGHAKPEPELDRFARIELLLVNIQHELDVQFRRIAALQAQVDRAITSDRLKPNL
jgi:hypothetical protein